MSYSTRHHRRRFLQGLGALVAGGTASALFPQLQLMGHALAATPSPGEYRALVCIFLFGGNDSLNMVLPTDTASSTKAVSRCGVETDTSTPHISLNIHSFFGLFTMQTETHSDLALPATTSPRSRIRRAKAGVCTLLSRPPSRYLMRANWHSWPTSAA